MTFAKSLNDNIKKRAPMKAKRVNIKTIFPELNIQTREIHRHCELSFAFLFWIVILIISFIICCILIAMLVVQYYKYEYSLITREIGVPWLPYPDVLLCPETSFNYSKMHAEGLDNDTIHHLLYPLKHSMVNKNQHLAKLNESVLNYEKWLSKKSGKINSFEDAYRHFAVKAEDYIRSCSIDGSEVDCFPSNESKKYPTMMWSFGTCYIISPSLVIDNVTNKPIVQSVPGRLGSFQIILQWPKQASKTMIGLAEQRTFQMLVSNTTETEMTAYGNPMPCRLGQDAIVAVKKRVMTKLGHPYGNCATRKEGELINKKLLNVSGIDYSYDECHLICQVAHAMNKCNNSCVMPGSLPLHVMEHGEHLFNDCSDTSVIDCMKIYTHKADCSVCVYPCEFTKFDKVIATGDNMSPDETTLEIYHDNLIYSIEMDKAVLPIESLMGSIGGQMSLWLGFKVATLLQLWYYGSMWICFAGCTRDVDDDDQSSPEPTRRDDRTISGRKNSELDDTVYTDD